MPRQEDHDAPENLVEAPGEAEHSARTLQEAADSNATLEGYYAINLRDPQQVENEATEDEQARDRKKEKPKP